MMVRFLLCSMATQRTFPQLSPSTSSSSSALRDLHSNSPVYQQALLSLQHPSFLHCICSHNSCPALLSFPCMSLSSQNQPASSRSPGLDNKAEKEKSKLWRSFIALKPWISQSKPEPDWQQPLPGAQPPGGCGHLSQKTCQGGAHLLLCLGLSHSVCDGHRESSFSCPLSWSPALLALAGRSCPLLGQDHTAFGGGQKVMAGVSLCWWRPSWS